MTKISKLKNTRQHPRTRSQAGPLLSEPFESTIMLITIITIVKMMAPQSGLHGSLVGSLSSIATPYTLAIELSIYIAF